MNIKAVLFDLDGTLVDTAPDLSAALNTLRRNAGMSDYSPEQLRPVASAGARGMLEMGMGIAPDDADYERLREEFLAAYRDNIFVHSTLFEGVESLLTRLENDKISWGIVTNKPGWLTKPLLDQMQLSRRAACIVSGDSAPRAKPAPDTLLLACEQIKLTPSECVYIGDDKRDIDAAKACNMPVLAARWGYLGENENPDNWLADGVINHPLDIVTWIQS